MKKKKSTNKIIGKIGYCDNKALGIKNSSGTQSGGHYVYIREFSGRGTCNVNTITSLENESGKYLYNKLHDVKSGYLYPIPKNDANFSHWSAINLNGNIKNISLTDIQNIGKKSIKKRHKFFVGKFTKK